MPKSTKKRVPPSMRRIVQFNREIATFSIPETTFPEMHLVGISVIVPQSIKSKGVSLAMMRGWREDFDGG